MELEKEILFVTEEGYKYLVSFIEFSYNGVNYEIPIVDVSITLMNDGIENNIMLFYIIIATLPLLR